MLSRGVYGGGCSTGLTIPISRGSHVTPARNNCIETRSVSEDGLADASGYYGELLCGGDMPLHSPPRIRFRLTCRPDHLRSRRTPRSRFPAAMQLPLAGDRHALSSHIAAKSAPSRVAAMCVGVDPVGPRGHWPADRFLWGAGNREEVSESDLRFPAGFLTRFASPSPPFRLPRNRLSVLSPL
jgi:hypothetical protein